MLGEHGIAITATRVAKSSHVRISFRLGDREHHLSISTSERRGALVGVQHDLRRILLQPTNIRD